ncbi:MAG: hypothetical protein DHS20C19_23220 [Acidimicrobiales bacterium]|nr:MAG: hypothetical protein DHS20C19_23220 [Acidimicrobiales bacterium]
MTPERHQRRATGDPSGGRDRLLAAATAVMQAGGPGAATSRTIADAAGMNLGSITYYFGSKDALVAEALAASGRRLLQPALDELHRAESPIERLLQTAQWLPTVLDGHQPEARAYAHALAAATHDDAVRRELEDVHRAMHEQLATTITDFQAAGVVPAWVAPDEMAALVVALVCGVAVTTAAHLATAEPAAIATQFAGLLIGVAASD